MPLRATRVTSDTSPAPCASSGHQHSVGTAWAPRRHPPPPCPTTPLSHTVPRSPGAQPGGEPVRWAGLEGRSTRGQGTLFLHQDLRTRSFNAERSQKPACTTSWWRRRTLPLGAARPAGLPHPREPPLTLSLAAGLPRVQWLLLDPLRRRTFGRV